MYNNFFEKHMKNSISKCFNKKKYNMFEKLKIVKDIQIKMIKIKSTSIKVITFVI